MDYNEYMRKYIFVKNMEMVLFLDKQRNDLEGIDYTYNKEAESEIIDITFKGGGTRRIHATGNSNGANAKEIINAIY